MGMWHFGGENHHDDFADGIYIPPTYEAVENHSCSICKHFTCDLNDLCIINPEVVNQRITFNQKANIFICDYNIPCDKFERNYDKMWGYIK